MLLIIFFSYLIERDSKGKEDIITKRKIIQKTKKLKQNLKKYSKKFDKSRQKIFTSFYLKYIIIL